MRKQYLTKGAIFLVAALVLLSTSSAWAMDTEAGTSISNTASVEFTIGGNTTTKDSPPVAFLVDRKIRPVVSNLDGGNVSIVAGANDVYLSYSVTNQSNTATGTDDYFYLTIENGATTDINMTGFEIWEDTDGNGTPDVQLTGDNLVVTIPNVDDGTNVKRYMIVADTPAGATTSDTDGYNLLATAWSGATVAAGILEDDATSSDGVNQAGTSEIVYADDATAGDFAADVATDGRHSDLGTFVVNEPITVDKIVGNGASGYQIPGDVVSYTITVGNTDEVNAASLVTIYDGIPANVTFETGTLLCPDATFDAYYHAGVKGTPPASNDAGWSTSETSPVNHVRCFEGDIAIAVNATTPTTASMTFDVLID